MKHAMLTLVLLAAAACGGHSPAPGSPVPEPITRSLTVAPGEFAELNLALPEAATVRVRFHADAPLDWNVHSHPGGEVRIHDSGTSADAEVPFTSTDPGVYSYLWENHGAAAVTLEIDLDLPAGGSVDSWHPAP